MQIRQWQNAHLSQFSYGIIDEKNHKMVLIDPFRDPAPFIKCAEQHSLSIEAIIETHAHADFISGHLDLHHLTGAPIYVHKNVGALYPHRFFPEENVITIGDLQLRSMHTPGHSADSICVLLLDKNEEKAIFTGDTLFAGDCGRPDLREVAGKIHSKREELATLMYHSLRDKLLILPDHVQVYPGHGAGSLCGKNINPDSVSTIGKEKRFNWCLQPMSEDEFILRLLNEQPFIPAYFAYDVELNIIGATALKTAIRNVKRSGCLDMAVSRRLDTRKWIVDGRDAHLYRCGHFAHSINLMENGSFETWLGTLIQPGEMFYLAATDQDQLERLILRAANIGYENQIQEAFTLESAPIVDPLLDKQDFLAHPGNYTIVDVREPSERRQRIPFSHSLSIPLSEMQRRVNDIITEKPIVVHCSGGYRSAAASSFMQSILDGNTVVYDLGPAIRELP